MKSVLIRVVSLHFAVALAMPALAQDASSTAPVTAPFPVQLEMRVPFEPTAFPSAGRTYLAYELYLTNFSGRPIALRRIEVLDADDAVTKPIFSFEGGQIASMLQRVGADPPTDSANTHELGPGSTIVAFMWIPFGHETLVPSRLRHRIVASDAVIEGAIIGTHHTKLHVLGPPLEGVGWSALDAPSNERDNHHRRGIFITDGQMTLSRRYAIDWTQIQNGAKFTGNENEARAYYAYGKPVVAVSSGIIVTASDGLPDNNPGHLDAFRPAVPITLDTVGGNTITIAMGDGQFAQYFHLQQGSVQIKAGDRVKRGQILARIGSSGDAREPHLHFEVTTSAKPLAGEGVPYVIESYRLRAEDGTLQERRREMPLRNMVVDFYD